MRKSQKHKKFYCKFSYSQNHREYGANRCANKIIQYFYIHISCVPFLPKLQQVQQL